MNLSLEDLTNPVTGHLFAAYQSIGLVLSKEYGDADPRHLIQGAEKAIGEALEALIRTSRSQRPGHEEEQDQQDGDKQTQ